MVQLRCHAAPRGRVETASGAMINAGDATQSSCRGTSIAEQCWAVLYERAASGSVALGAGLLAERSLRASMHHLRTIRTLVDLNIGFIKQLLDLERSLHTGDNVSAPCLWTDFLHACLQTFDPPWCPFGRVKDLHRRWSWCHAVIGTITHRQQKLRSLHAHLQTSKTVAQTVDWGPGQATLHGGHRCLWTLSSARISCSSSSSTEEICISFQPQHPSILTATRAVHERTPTWRGGQEPPVGPRVERARESGREEGIGGKGR